MRLESPGQGRSGHRGQGTPHQGTVVLTGQGHQVHGLGTDLRGSGYSAVQCYTWPCYLGWRCRESYNVTMEERVSLLPLLSLVPAIKKKKKASSHC